MDRRLLNSLALCAAALCASGLSGADVEGVVVDARGGETLARVRVQLTGTTHQTTTGRDGRFSFASVEPGGYTLHVETVGYRLLTREFTLSAGENKEFQIVLSPDTFRRTDSVDVKADPFELVQSASASELTLSATEIKNLGTVLIDDPVRAVQSLPGVISNNDYYSQFTVYGAPFSNIGIYLDDILLHSPFHTVQGIRDGGSASILNGDSIENISLLPVAFPSLYADRSGSALDMHTREGSRTKPSIRATASVAQVNVLAEGPLTRSKRGSWMASARKSYAQYIARRLTDDPAQAFGYIDGQGKLTYDLTARQTLSLQASDARTGYDHSDKIDRLGVNSLVWGNYHITLARAGWRYVPNARLLFQAAGAWMRERFDNLNRDSRPLGAGTYGEWVGNANAIWYWTGHNALEAGWSARRLRSEGFESSYILNSDSVRVRDRYRGTALRQGGYAQQSWSALHNRVRLSAGFRWDRHDLAAPTPLSAHAAAGFGLTSSTQLQLGWGQYVQYPDMQLIGSTAGGTRLLPERANHYVASIDQRVSRFARIRVEAWQRENRDSLARPLLDPRWINGRFVSGPANPLYENSVRGYSRGVQILAQSRSANRLSGWISYTLGYTRNRDGVEQTEYWSVEDQRHTVNVYLSYRIRPSVNLSGKWAYGSGTPLPGFFREQGEGVYFLTATRNDVRLGDYQRLDLRINKSFVFDRWKLTLYGELINATNHHNPRFTSYNGADTRTGRASLSIERVFPILPSGGIMLEF
jgi:hypothetical protein